MKGGETTVAWVFGVAALLWIFGDPVRGLFHVSGRNYEAVVAMSAAVALAGSRTLSMASLRRIPWSTLVLLGGSFALAAGIEASGLSVYLASRLSGLAGLPLLQQLAVTSASTVLLSAVASNTATISVMLNVLPRSLPVLSAATIAASCDFALPAGTPPNAIVFGSGYVRLPVMMRTGVLLDLLAVVAITLYGVAWIQFVM
jgi:sodium-dependent dicarboxylate transporter 2/3/5